MKDHNRTRIQTDESEWPSSQNTTYPPSPESQGINPALLPPKRSRKKRKRKGLFSGRIPWFVYFLTLVQITVFIVEIVKNCKYTSVGAKDAH